MQKKYTEEALALNNIVSADPAGIASGYIHITSSIVSKSLSQIFTIVAELLKPLEVYAVSDAADKTLAHDLLVEVLVQKNLNPAMVNLAVRNFFQTQKLSE